MNANLTDVKKALGITGEYQDETLQVYFDEVVSFLIDAGVAESNITSGIVARGVSDLWNYGSGEGKLSQYFVQRAIQLAGQGGSSSSSGGGGGDLSNYYTKMETDALLLLKANVDDVYIKAEIDAFLQTKQDKFGEVSTDDDNVVISKEFGAIIFDGDIRVEQLETSKDTSVANMGMVKAYHDDTKQNITDNTLETESKQIPIAINEVNSIAKGAQQGIVYGDYETLITAFNALASDVYNVGRNIFIVTLEVPDLWISAIESENVPYTYTTDEAFVTALQTDGYVQVGFYKLSALETGKVDLTDYYDKTETDGLLADKLTEPSSGLAVGKYFRVASIDPEGHAVLECVDAPIFTPAMKIGTTVPTTSTAADYIGQLYEATTANGILYFECIAIDNGSYTWKRIYLETSTEGIVIGNSRAEQYGTINIGQAKSLSSGASGRWSTCIGFANSCRSQYGVAISGSVGANANNAIQLGSGTNSTPNTFSVGYQGGSNYRLLEADGTIPPERITSANWTDTQRLAILASLGCTVDENGFVKFTSQT